jgi:hypothetical protein
VPWAGTVAWAADSWPLVNAAAVCANGPQNRARAVRTELAAAPAPSRRRVRSQAAVDPVAWSWSAPAAPPAIHPHPVLSHWPSPAVQQPPQPKDLLGQGHITQPVRILGLQVIHGRGQGG